MPMQNGLITGHQGNCTITAGAFSAQMVHVTDFRARWVSDMYSADVFGSATVTGHKSIRGMYRLSGSITFHPAGDPLCTTTTADFFEPDGATPNLSTMALVERTGHTWAGNGRLNNVELSVSKGSGLNSYTADFESDGNWTCTEAA